ncbi:MAG: metal ABC transporter substrate-binding protein [Nitrospinota bacterium]
MNKRLFLTIFILLNLPCLLWAKVTIVTTTEDLAAISREVGGDLVRVNSLSQGSQDPHFVDPRPSMILKVKKADLLMLVGAELETGWLPVLLRSARNGKILPGEPGYLDASETVEMLGKPKGNLNRSMGDIHGKGNPHYWLLPKNAIKIAKALLNRLLTIDPGSRKVFEANFQTFQKNVVAKTEEWKSRMLPLQGAKIIEYHLSWEYLAHAFGLTIVGQVEPKPGISPSPAHLGRLLSTIKDENVSFLIYENFREHSSGKFLSEKTGVEVLRLPISVGGEKGIKTWFDLMDFLVEKMAATTGRTSK